MTEFVTQGESDLFNWIDASEPHTVLGKEDVDTGMKSWWFCTQKGKFTRIGEVHNLTSAELVTLYTSDIFWIESVPLGDLFEVEEEDDEEEVASVN